MPTLCGIDFEYMYERKNALNKASLMRRLVKLEYIDGKSVIKHLICLSRFSESIVCNEIGVRR